MADDSSAVLWALPPFAPRDLRAVGGGVAQAGAPVAWLAPGAGLGVSGFMPLLGGDLVPRLGDWFLRSPFRRRFEAGGHDRDLLRTLPTLVVRPGLAPVPVAAGDELAAMRSLG